MRKPLRKSSSVRGKPVDEINTEYVEILRPAKMAKVPDHFRPCGARCPNNWQCAGEIIFPRLLFDEMPPKSLPGYSYPLANQTQVIQMGVPIMFRLPNQILNSPGTSPY